MAWWLLATLTLRTNKPKRCQFTSLHSLPYLRVLKAKCFEFQRVHKVTECDGRIQWSIIDILWMLLSERDLTQNSSANNSCSTNESGNNNKWEQDTESVCDTLPVSYGGLLGFEAMIVTNPFKVSGLCARQFSLNCLSCTRMCSPGVHSSSTSVPRKAVSKDRREGRRGNEKNKENTQ